PGMPDDVAHPHVKVPLHGCPIRRDLHLTAAEQRHVGFWIVGWLTHDAPPFLVFFNTRHVQTMRLHAPHSDNRTWRSKRDSARRFNCSRSSWSTDFLSRNASSTRSRIEGFRRLHKKGARGGPHDIRLSTFARLMLSQRNSTPRSQFSMLCGNP